MQRIITTGKDILKKLSISGLTLPVIMMVMNMKVAD